jgi:hypothetical protein
MARRLRPAGRTSVHHSAAATTVVPAVSTICSATQWPGSTDRGIDPRKNSSAVLAGPETLTLYNISGPEDFFVHVAVADNTPTATTRRRDHLATRPEAGHAPERPDLRPVAGRARRSGGC